ncbi:DNA/RNA helicase domain-containing protein [Cochleicola gelatinilyticus]|uniref:Schlafen group 3-like DNA/RNA helicase domain-containing protein n=1 Tax=Cochleicola gelatinilyticus TaxID=1763537 RepID=A0A167HN85_9FLAO|nr:DNA/RNA helicase domain-containing protein [Cochleicola gelatinilyticus]OAB78792.1 hypothetical protein ULVI_09425 [Cochleicola gelatinilyticus]
MTEVNILSITQAYKTLDESLFKRYCDYLKINPKKSELDDLAIFVEYINTNCFHYDHLDKYFYSYNIPQISKEFDLLRFGTEFNINIEIKRESTENKILKQLIKNRYYLSFLDGDTQCYTFISSEKKLYKLNNDNELIEFGIYDLREILIQQEVKYISDIDKLFNPSNYLVSPFNSTEKFVKGEYFLTGHQLEIKTKSLKILGDNTIPSFVSIIGKAGTGKSLLAYDIAKDYIELNKSALLVHCGILNKGHFKLIEEYNWTVTAIKYLHNYDLTNYDLIVIDETQRIYPRQLNTIIKKIQDNNLSCIFSYDKKQWLRLGEAYNNIDDLIKTKTSCKEFNLTDKIRTNKEIASFIKALFNNSVAVHKLNRSNIELKYFKNSADAREYIELLGEEDWKIINYTSSRSHRLPYDNFAVNEQDNAHGVIGQEFDKVIAVLDSHFYYHNNELTTKAYQNNYYYHPTKMLFQIVTRTRRKLCVIVINNSVIMDRCLNILNV